MQIHRSPIVKGVRCALMASLLTVTTITLGSTQSWAQDGTIIAAVNPPPVDTNRFWAGGSQWHVMDPILEGLIEHDPITGERTGSGLALSWEHNADYTVWTFKLREGVQFHHDWGQFTAADVVHSYQLATGEDAVLAGIDQLSGAQVEAIDEHTVRFSYDTPRLELLFLHGGRSVMKIYSKAQFDAEGLEGYDNKPAGTGYFEFVSREPGKLVVKRFDDHYGSAKPNFQTLELRFVSEAATKLALLLSEEADISEIPRELLSEATSAGMETADSTRTTMQTDVVMNGLYCETGDAACGTDYAWSDKRIRMAINHAINRDEMLEVLFPDGGATLLAKYAHVEGHEGFDPTILERFVTDYAYNPELARELMAEAGYPDAFDNPVIPLAVAQNSGQPEIPLQMELLHLYLTEVGFQAELVDIDHATVGSKGRAREAYLLHPSRNAPPRPSEVAFRAFYSNPGGPYQGWEDDFTSKSVNTVLSSKDPQERDTVARELWNYLYEERVDIPLFEIRTQVSYNPKTVSGWQFPGVTSAGFGHWNLVEAIQ